MDGEEGINSALISSPPQKTPGNGWETDGTRLTQKVRHVLLRNHLVCSVCKGKGTDSKILRGKKLILFKFGNIVPQRVMDKRSIRRLSVQAFGLLPAHNLLNDVPHPHPPLHTHSFDPIWKIMDSNPLPKLKFRNAIILKVTL